MVYIKCDSCDGKGYVRGKACPRCQGLGKINATPKPETSKGKKRK